MVSEAKAVATDAVEDEVDTPALPVTSPEVKLDFLEAGNFFFTTFPFFLIPTFFSCSCPGSLQLEADEVVANILLVGDGGLEAGREDGVECEIDLVRTLF